MATSVKVSARLLHYPQICCCCGGTPQAVIVSTATRTTGVRVVRAESKSWSFPVCNNCLSHDALYTQAERDHAAATHFRLEAIVWIVMGVLLAGCLVGLPILAFGVFNLVSRYPLKVLNASAVERQARSRTSRSCSCRTEFVVYRSWSGSVHSFEFESDGYGAAFVAMNRSKIVP